jgi:metal-responsive CopG/Arc/MetJ family transcriptional regulator
MNYTQIVEICCRDLRRYLEYAIQVTRGGVVSVKMKNLLRAELSLSDRIRYSTCLSRILYPWRWKHGSYVILRRDAEKLLESFDSLCESVKNARRRSEPRPRRPREELVPIAVTLPNDLLRALDEYARLHNTSRSAVVRQAVQQLLDMRKALEELDKARNGQLERVALRLPLSLFNALNERAASLKATRSAIIRYAIYKLIEKMKTETAP